MTLNFLTALLLLKSAVLLSRVSHLNSPTKAQDDNRTSVAVILLFACIPIFNISGVLLLPDAPLLFACAGSLYFALKSCEESVSNNETKLSLKNALYLGFFIGLGIVSKYQGVPLSIGLFLAVVCLRGFKKSIQNDVPFWMVTILTALVISSPLFIWNLQNNFASFKFQGQHGFLSWKLNLGQFVIYMLLTIGILLPWYFYLFVKQIKLSLSNKKLFKSLDIIPLFGFLSIFLFIGSSSLGKAGGRVHWITPSFLFLIPLVAVNWNVLTEKHAKLWKNIHIFSASAAIFLFTVAFSESFQTFLAKNKTVLGYNIERIQNGLFAGMLWKSLENVESDIAENVPELQGNIKQYFSHLDQTKCSAEPYFATFNWRWASQLAFHMKNNPRVFSIHLSRTTYYTWRDSLPFLAGCRVFVVGDKSMYREAEVQQIMDIQSTREFAIKMSYSNKKINMIFIDGIMKNHDSLQKISTDLLQNARY